MELVKVGYTLSWLWQEFRDTPQRDSDTHLALPLASMENAKLLNSTGSTGSQKCGWSALKRERQNHLLVTVYCFLFWERRFGKTFHLAVQMQPKEFHSHHLCEMYCLIVNVDY